jgi:segregation and condensation protein B
MPELKHILESFIFVSDAPLSLDRLCALLEEHERGDIRAALTELADDYRQRPGAVVLTEVAGGFQFRTRTEFADYLKRLTRVKAPKFSQSALETLAIIAYRQPITRVEVEYLRGVDCGTVLKTLLEKRLIRILGKKDIPGKPLIYGTTREFLELFSLRDLASLPTLREIQDLGDRAFDDGQQELPLGEEGEGGTLLEGKTEVEGEIP